MPTVGTDNVESLLGEVLGSEHGTEHGHMHGHVQGLLDEGGNVPVYITIEEPRADFNREFDELADIDADGHNEGKRIPIL